MNVRVSSATNWYHEDGTYVTGSAFVRKDSGIEYSSTSELCSLIKQCETVSQVESLTNRINGFFAFIHNLGDKMVAAVDHIASIPVYYTEDGSQIGDSLNAILGDVNSSEFDAELEAEYLLTRYVTASDTVHPDIQRLLAGSLLIADTNGKWVTTQYTEYYPNSDFEVSVDSSRAQLAKAITNSIGRLCDVASGRPIFVLLSGGNDSKLVLSELVKQEYSPLKALTFGRKGISDVTVSETIADSLGVDRIYVEYDETTWDNWFNPEENELYTELHNKLDVFPSNWAWPALADLSHGGDIPKDAIFVTGDTIASIGEHLPDRPLSSRQELIEYILENHYVLWDMSPSLEERMKKRIANSLPTPRSEGALLSDYEMWEWQERQSKWMTQDCETFSFFGYDWWLPLFDREVMEAWSTLPISARRDKRALVEITENVYSSQVDGSQRLNRKQNTVERIMRLVAESRFRRVIEPVYRQYKSITGFGTHPLGYEGMFGDEQPGSKYNGAQNVNSYRVMFEMDRMSFRPPDATGIPEDCELSYEKLQTLPRVTR